MSLNNANPNPSDKVAPVHVRMAPVTTEYMFMSSHDIQRVLRFFIFFFIKISLIDGICKDVCEMSHSITVHLNPQADSLLFAAVLLL